MSILDGVRTGEAPSAPGVPGVRRIRRTERPDGMNARIGDDHGARHLPPIIHSLTAGGPAYLLHWEELEPRVWGAEIAWVEWAGRDWRPRRLAVRSEDLTELDDQDYRTVPRYRLRDRFRPGAPAKVPVRAAVGETPMEVSAERPRGAVAATTMGD